MTTDSFSSQWTTYIVSQVQASMTERTGDAKLQAMQAAQGRLAKILGDIYAERGPRDPGNIKLYPSESGKCARQIQYKALGIPGEPMSSDVQWKLAMGNLLEMALLYVIEATPGVTLVENNQMMDVQIGGRAWRGASDGVLVTGSDRRNVEVKSASGIGFKMTLQKGIDDNFGYLTQASVYMRQMLKEGRINVPETVFVYIDRDRMKMAEFVVKYDLALAERADEKFVAVVAGVATKKMVERPYALGGDGSLGLQCSYCSHKHTCWTQPHQAVTFKDGVPTYRDKPTRELQMVMSGRKPKWFLV